MSTNKKADENGKKDFSLEGALEIVGDGFYTNFVAFVCGLLTLSAISSVQCMYYILPAVSCELGISGAPKGFLASAPFLGSLMSATWFGFLVDQYGRRRILLITTTGSSLAAIVMSFAPNGPTLMCFAFLTGILLGGVFGIPFVFLSEFCPNKIISRKLILVAVVSSLTNTFSPCAAWLTAWLDFHFPVGGSFIFSPWRLYLIVNVVPMMLSAFFVSRIPESPKYLLSKGRRQEALQALSRVYAKNNRKEQQDFPVGNLITDLNDVDTKSKEAGFLNFLVTMWRQMKELFTPPLIKYTAICASMQTAVVGMYSVVFMWVPDETQKMLKYLTRYGTYDATICDVMSTVSSAESSGKCNTDTVTYFVSITVGLVYIVFSLLLIYVVRKVRLKIILGYNILIAGVLCVVMLFFKSIYLTLTALGLVVSILAATQPAVYGIVVQFFPTPLRATATTVTLVFARISVIIGGALFGAAFHNYCNLAYSILAALLMGISVICFLTPNSRSTPNQKVSS